MRKFVTGLVIALTAVPALADPLVDTISSEGGMACFTRTYDSAWIKAHRGQTLREVKLAFSQDMNSPTISMRLSRRGPRGTFYGFGECWWAAGDLNRGAQKNILDPGFKPTTGVACHMPTDITGSSAEEGAEFPVDWRDGKTIEVHFGESLALWSSYDISRPGVWQDLKSEDRIVRLNRASPSSCQQLVKRFAPNGFE